MKQTTWEQSDWTYFFLFLTYRTARRPETRFRAGWVSGRYWRAQCIREVYMCYGRASWVNCGGFGATRGVSRRARIRDCTTICFGVTARAAVHARDLPKYRRAGWTGCGDVEARRAGSARRERQLNINLPPRRRQQRPTNDAPPGDAQHQRTRSKH